MGKDPRAAARSDRGRSLPGLPCPVDPEAFERLEARVDVVRLVLDVIGTEPLAALDAQPRAALLAQGRDRLRERDRVRSEGAEVELVVVREPGDLRLGRGVDRAPGRGARAR